MRTFILWLILLTPFSSLFAATDEEARATVAQQLRQKLAKCGEDDYIVVTSFWDY